MDTHAPEVTLLRLSVTGNSAEVPACVLKPALFVILRAFLWLRIAEAVAVKFLLPVLSLRLHIIEEDQFKQARVDRDNSILAGLDALALRCSRWVFAEVDAPH
ncbi:hypothetical protein D9M69_569630 [compost metagenome]